MRSRYPWILLAGATALSLVASACGGATATATPQPTAAPTKAAPTATTAPQATATLAPAPTATARPQATATSAPAPTATQPAARVPAGDLRVSVASLSRGVFDPQIGGTSTNHFMITPVMDLVTMLSTDGQPQPGIAERWESSADGKTWTFNIRKGVKFHDGSDLTAADVKFSLDRLMAKEATASASNIMRSTIDTIQVKDPSTVVINLKRADAELWVSLGPAEGAAVVLPQKYVEAAGIENFRQKPIGSGPWKVKSWDSAGRIDFEAVDKHWRAVPYFKTLRLSAIPEASTTMAMLKTGQVDLAPISIDRVDEARKGSLTVTAVKDVYTTAVVNYWDLANPKQFPIGDLRVRKALSLAINRQELADKLYSGFASPAALFGVKPPLYFFDPNVLKPDPYDPAQARKLLADAGFPNGFTLKYYSMPLEVWLPTFNEAVAGYWEAIGVKVQLTPIEYAGLRPIIQDRRQDAYGTVAGFRNASINSFQLRIVYHSKDHTASQQSPGDPELDKLIDQTEAAVDPQERKRLALAASALAAKHLSAIPGLHIDAVVAMGPKVGSWKPIQGNMILGLAFETIAPK